MLSGGYFGVISPEGAASILGRYKDDAHKAQQFPIGEWVTRLMHAWKRSTIIISICV